MEEAIVSVITRVANMEDISYTSSFECESAENYFIKHFNERTVMLGPASRNVSLLYIKGQIEIIAHLIRTSEMARLYKELHSELDIVEMPEMSFVSTMSCLLDNLPTELLIMHKCLSHLYTRIVCCRKGFICSGVEVLFLENLQAGETHQYNQERSLQDKGVLVGFCLCILIAEQEDKKFSRSLSLTGETGTCTTDYHMSAGDTCILPGSCFHVAAKDNQWCTTTKPILIVFNYRPRPHPDTITGKDGPHGGTAEDSCMINTVTPVKLLQEKRSAERPSPLLNFMRGPDAYINQRLQHLLLSIDFKRRTRDGNCPSRFTLCMAEAGEEPHQGMALQFLSSIFNDRDILRTLKPEAGRHSLDQVTIFILAETNTGLIQVLALAHIKFFLNVGILVKWLAVTAENISETKYGSNADGGSWRKRGLSSILLNTAQQIGKSMYSTHKFPSIFAEVRGDAVDAQAFYNKKGFVKVNKFPACVEKDLLQNNMSTITRDGLDAILIEEGPESILQRMELKMPPTHTPSARSGTRARKQPINS